MMVDDADIKPVIMPVIDRHEQLGIMEPMLIAEGSRHRGRLLDLAADLIARSAGFRSGLPEGIRSALADLTRAMNCYYSNLIEGHDTHPLDIERALESNYSNDPWKRNLQLEAKAHIEVQRWIDDGALVGRACTADGIREVHLRFCELLPDELLRVEDLETGERLAVVPGELRTRDVRVGRHVPVSPGAVPRFLQRFEATYANLGRVDSLISVAAAHHRLLWVHPFIDGNGRVSRLMSYAVLRDTLDPGGVWSVARGLARREADYKCHLAACDLPRRNDLDGRGTLSEEALAAFTAFFLETCLDQLQFMETLVQPDRLRSRILSWSSGEASAGFLHPKAGAVLEAVLYRGELRRSEVAEVLGMGERQARRVTADLVRHKVLVSDSSRAPLRLAFPAALGSSWMPGLFPEAPG